MGIIKAGSVMSRFHPSARIELGTTPIRTMAPTMLHVGAIQDHQAGYIRRAF
jgi:hypothetical protein